MTLKYNVPLELNADVQSHLFSQTKAFQELVRTRMIIIIVVLTTIFALFVIANRNRLPVALSGIILYIAALLIGRKRIPIAVKKSIRKIYLKALHQQFEGEDNEYDGDVTILLDDFGLHMQGGENLVEEPFENLTEITEEGDFLYVFTKDFPKAFSIPLFAFTTPEEKQQFLSQLEAHMTV